MRPGTRSKFLLFKTGRNRNTRFAEALPNYHHLKNPIHKFPISRLMLKVTKKRRVRALLEIFSWIFYMNLLIGKSCIQEMRFHCEVSPQLRKKLRNNFSLGPCSDVTILHRSETKRFRNTVCEHQKFETSTNKTLQSKTERNSYFIGTELLRFLLRNVPKSMLAVTYP